MQQTPDGLQVWLPDTILPPVPAPQQVAVPDYSTATGMQPPPMPIPQPPPPPPPPPPQHLGVAGGIGADEVAAAPDQGPASVTGGALPSEVQQAAMNGFAPVQSSPDYQLAAKQAAPIQAADAAANAAYAKAQAAQAKVQAKQAAYNATPQGMQDQAVKGELEANKEQQGIVTQQGDLAAQEADEAARIKDKQVQDEQALFAKQQGEAEERMQKQQALFDDYQKAVEDAAKKKVDPNRMWNSMSTGQHILAGIGVLLSGFGQGLNQDKGPNPAMKLITDAIDRDVDAQKTDINQANQTVQAKQGSFRDYQTLMGNADAAATAKRAEGRVIVADQLDASAMHFKSPAAKLAAQQSASQLRGQAQALLGGLAEKKITQEHQAQELAIQKQQIGIAAGHLNLAKQQFDWTKQKDQQQLAIDFMKAMKGDHKQAKDLAEGGVMVPTGVSPDGKPTYEPIKNQDNQPLIIPEKLREKFADKREGMMKAMDAVDSLRRLRSDTGGNITNWTPEARAKLQEFERAIVGLHEANGITRFSPDVIDLMKKQLTGGADPTAVFQSIMPSLDLAREDIEKDFDGTLRSYGNYTGDQFHVFDPLSVPKAAVTPEDEQFQAALENPRKKSVNDLAAELGVNAANYNSNVKFTNDTVAKLAANKGLLPSQVQVVQNLAQLATSSDPKIQQQAAKQLAVLQDQAQVPAMRQAARDALVQVGLSAAPTSEEGEVKSSATARETVPAAK